LVPLRRISSGHTTSLHKKMAPGFGAESYAFV